MPNIYTFLRLMGGRKGPTIEQKRRLKGVMNRLAQRKIKITFKHTKIFNLTNKNIN